MCEPTTIMVITMAVAGTAQAYGQYQQGKAQQKMYDYQASLALQEAAMKKKYADEQAVMMKGVTEEQQKAIKLAGRANITATQDAAADESKRLAKEVAQLTGKQKATIGAMGVSGVTASDIATSTFDQSRLDQLAIRYNANIKSASIRDQALKDVWFLGEQSKYDLWALGEETKMQTWSKESEASQYSLAGKQAKKAGQISAATTIFNTAASMATVGTLTAKPKPKPTGGVTL